VSALQALETLKVSRGSSVFIQGGAGGIGSFAIQIAKHLGARVVASCRGSAVEYVKSLGADQVIDFEKSPVPGNLHDFDAVLDTVGGEAYKASFAILKKGGTIITIAGMPDAELAAKHGVTALGQMTEVSTPRLERLTAMVANGKVKVHIERTFPLDKVQDAFRAREAGHGKGKIVLQIRE
jgi:NADPH:quinone reductase-like Zn-dependent oxidoreductase